MAHSQGIKKVTRYHWENKDTRFTKQKPLAFLNLYRAEGHWTMNNLGNLENMSQIKKKKKT